MVGSSPHTRGAPLRRRGRSGRPGIIPAYAGSTAGVVGFGATAADHPRIRGEHWSLRRSSFQISGSSPHTRGAHGVGPVGVRAARIIPAYAGSTSHGTGWAAPATDHPRIRGEHDQMIVAELEPLGSSPHTRGARGVDGDESIVVRDHPRIRGEHMTTYLTLSFEKLDHPRIRGEHALRQFARPFLDGSSPHTRGAHRVSSRPPRYHRIIPAYAGSTGRLGPWQRGAADHPRIRGEHPRNVFKAIEQTRIIPAYAGSTTHKRPT